MAAPTLPKPNGPTGPLTLNDHAQAIILALPEPLPQIILEICRSQGFQLWHFIDGHILKADQRSELHAPLLLPEWTDRSETPVSEIVSGGRRCKACKQVMVHTRSGADYCCNYCGSGRWAKEQMHHPACEFYIVPKRHVALKVPGAAPDLTPPPDPSAREKWQAEWYERHVREAEAADTAPGGLPSLPDDYQQETDWRGAGQRA